MIGQSVGSYDKIQVGYDRFYSGTACMSKPSEEHKEQRTEQCLGDPISQMFGCCMRISISLSSSISTAESASSETLAGIWDGNWS